MITKRTHAFIAVMTLCLFLGQPHVQAASKDAPKDFVFSLFSSKMVFPRDVQAPVWGWASPGECITVAMENKTATAIADETGKWQVRLGPFAASMKPHTLTVSGTTKKKSFTDIVIGDVWLCSGQSNMTMGIHSVDNAVQEVAQAHYPGIRFFDILQWYKNKWSITTPETITDAGMVRSSVKLPNGKWDRHGFSAAAYFFGRDLHKEIKVPVGLVHSSAPGTFIEMWSGSKVLDPLVQKENTLLNAWFEANEPDTKGWEKAEFDDSAWESMSYPLKEKQPAYKGILWLRKTITMPENWEGKALRFYAGWTGNPAYLWINGHYIGIAYPSNEGLFPARHLRPGKNTIAIRVLNTRGGFGIRTSKAKDLRIMAVGASGSVSLQGLWKYKKTIQETDFLSAPPSFLMRHSDATMGGGKLFRQRIEPLGPFAFKGVLWYQGEANQGAFAATYENLLSGMITDWRRTFNNPALPFVIVQIANCKGRKPATDLRIPLLREAQTKVAQKMPQVCMAVSADTGLEQNQHPTNKQAIGLRAALKAREHVYGHTIDSSGPVFTKMRKSDAGLELFFDHVGDGLQASGERLLGFYIAGNDGNFVPAQASITGKTVVVSSPTVPAPTQVRYGWGSWTPCDLYNSRDLPAEPFRTDSLPMKY
jgi:sialate O-acetylesterase